MQQKYKIMVLLVVLVLGMASYFTYSQYNEIKTKEYLKSTSDLKIEANHYFDQAAAYEKRGDYSRAILAYQNSSDIIIKALFNDKQALNTASGVYREYLDVDIHLLETTAKLVEYKIYQNQYLNNSLNQGQEKVNPAVLAPYIEKLTSEVAALKRNQEQIKNSHPADFNFLE